MVRGKGDMKKAIGIIFMGLMFCNIAKATSLTPLIEYFEKNKTTDPAVQVYTLYHVQQYTASQNPQIT